MTDDDNSRPDASQPTAPQPGADVPPPVPPLARVPHLTNLQSRSLTPPGVTFKPTDLSNTIGLEDPRTPPTVKDGDSKP